MHKNIKAWKKYRFTELYQVVLFSVGLLFIFLTVTVKLLVVKTSKIACVGRVIKLLLTHSLTTV